MPKLSNSKLPIPKLNMSSMPQASLAQVIFATLEAFCAGYEETDR